MVNEGEGHAVGKTGCCVGGFVGKETAPSLYIL